MKRKLYLTCALLSVSSSIMLQAMRDPLQAMRKEQAMREQRKITEQNLATPAEINEFYYKTIVDLIVQQKPQEALRVLQRALQRGFDINYSGSGSVWGPLLSVALRGTNDVELIDALIKAGADPNNTENYFKQAPLTTAVMHQNNPSIIKRLINAGADVNRDNPLVTAVMAKKRPIVTTLLSAPGIDVMAESQVGTAYHVAKGFGHTEIIRLLERYLMTPKGKKSIEASKVAQEEIGEPGDYAAPQESGYAAAQE